jgi:hypothetical protein
MAEPARDGVLARLRKLPGQLLLALINATAVLVIAAAILALVALARIDHFAGNLAATMTETVLSKLDLPPRDALANLRNLTAEVRALRGTLADIKATEQPLLRAEIARLRESLTALHDGVERLASARSALTDETIARLARTAADAVIRLRGCSSGDRAGRSWPEADSASSTSSQNENAS